VLFKNVLILTEENLKKPAVKESFSSGAISEFENSPNLKDQCQRPRLWRSLKLMYRWIQIDCIKVWAYSTC